MAFSKADETAGLMPGNEDHEMKCDFSIGNHVCSCQSMVLIFD